MAKTYDESPIPAVEDIRIRCGQSVVDMVSNPSEYYRSQIILRDRDALLHHYDALEARCRELEAYRRETRKFARLHSAGRACWYCEQIRNLDVPTASETGEKS